MNWRTSRTRRMELEDSVTVTRTTMRKLKRRTRMRREVTASMRTG